MDLDFTADTIASHLAGSLRACRWIEGCDDSRWHLEMRIFRKQRAWENVIDEGVGEMEKPTCGGHLRG